MKRRFSRGVRVRLECDCEHVLASSLYRITRATAALIVGHHARRGVWCTAHPGMGAITDVIGTERL